MTNHTLQRQMIQSGALLCGIAVALGAFGAHQLKDVLDENALKTFETGIRYQFYHGIAILFLGTSMRRLHEQTVKWVWQLFITGIGLFSLSLYLLATKEIIFGTQIADNLRWVAGLTPIGGVCFLSGWALLVYKGYHLKQESSSGRVHRTHRTKNEEEAEKTI